MVASDLSDDFFLNNILIILIEIPGILFCCYAMDKFGRKPCLAYSQMIAGIACVAAGFLIGFDPRIPVSNFCRVSYNSGEIFYYNSSEYESRTRTVCPRLIRTLPKYAIF